MEKIQNRWIQGTFLIFFLKGRSHAFIIFFSVCVHVCLLL